MTVRTKLVSMKGMSRGSRRTLLYLLLLLATCLWAQSPPADKVEQSTIANAKKIQASKIDARLPRVSLAFFLDYESEGAPIHWKVNDCGDQTGNPSADQGRNFPVCVEAGFDVHHRSVSVVIAVGNSTQRDRATPGFFSGTITDPDGTSHSIKQLGDLPAQLRRPFPRQLRDLPDVRALSNATTASSG